MKDYKLKPKNLHASHTLVWLRWLKRVEPLTRVFCFVRLIFNHFFWGRNKFLVLQNWLIKYCRPPRRNKNQKFAAARRPQQIACSKFLARTQWASQRGGEEGLRLQSQDGQDLCGAAAAEHFIFKTSTEEPTVDLTNKGMTKDSERFSPWFHSVWRTTGPILWYSVPGGCMKVQTSADTCEGMCGAEQRTKNTVQPGLWGSFVSSQWRGQKNTHT